MPKIPATLEKTLTVNAPIADIYAYFHDPAQRSQDAEGLQSLEKIGDNRARWILTEKSEKGVTFQPDYTIEYSGNGTDAIQWRSVAGNIDIEGTASLRSLGDSKTEVTYKETMAPDLPINRLLAKVFKPIVSRNVKSGLEEFLDTFQKRFG